MDNKQYRINNLINAYRKPNTLPSLTSQNETGPIIKKYTNKFTDGFTREKVPIHVQASKEITGFSKKSALYTDKDKLAPLYREERKEASFLPANKENKKFRIRPQTPKLDMIQIVKKSKLSKIEEFKEKEPEIPIIFKHNISNNSDSLKIKPINKVEKREEKSKSKFGSLPDINISMNDSAKKPGI